MAKVNFQNPQNEYIETYNTSTSPLWCLLFGPLYWLVRRNIFHAIISLALAIFTIGISHFIYPFFANKINFKTYGRKGWVKINTISAVKDTQHPDYKNNSIQTETSFSSPIDIQNQTKFDKTGSLKDWRPKSIGKLILMIFIVGFVIGTAMFLIKDNGAPSTLYQITQ